MTVGYPYKVSYLLCTRKLSEGTVNEFNLQQTETPPNKSFHYLNNWAFFEYKRLGLIDYSALLHSDDLQNVMEIFQKNLPQLVETCENVFFEL
eukprot:UN22987